MNAKKILVAMLGAVAISGYSTAGLAGGWNFGHYQLPSPLEGTWIVSVRPIICTTGVDVPNIPPVKSHLTFGRGGTLVEVTSNPSFGVGSRSAGNGWWERSGRTSYQFALQAFVLEPKPPYQTGLQRIEQTLELHTQDEWTSSGPVQFFATFDLNESPGLAPYRAGCARATGVRMY